MYSVKQLYDDIVLLADALEENDIDNFKFPKGVNNEEIKAWEKENNALLPGGYKSFLFLANGFRNHGTEIYSLEQITKVDSPEEYKGYYAIGSYIGDGSCILADEKGDLYLGNHAGMIEKSTFEAFVEKWILEDMKQALSDNDIKLPENMKTNKKKDQPILSNERFQEIMAKRRRDKEKK